MGDVSCAGFPDDEVVAVVLSGDRESDDVVVFDAGLEVVGVEDVKQVVRGGRWGRVLLLLAVCCGHERSPI